VGYSYTRTKGSHDTYEQDGWEPMHLHPRTGRQRSIKSGNSKRSLKIMAINLYDYEYRIYYDAHGLAKNEDCFLAEVIGWEHVKGDGQTPAAAMCREILELSIESNLRVGNPIPPPVKGVSLAASAFGRLGGKSKSPAKLAAVRRNGRLGGRPRKVRELVAA